MKNRGGHFAPVKVVNLNWNGVVTLSGFSIQWTKDLISEYKDSWDWDALARNPSINGNREIINAFTSLKKAIAIEDNREEQGRSEFDIADNASEYYSLDYIEKYKSKLNWEYISAFGRFDLTENLLQKYKDLWVWGRQISHKNGSIEIQPGLSSNSYIQWTQEIIDNHLDDINWYDFSYNPGLPWTIELVEKYFEYWDKNNLLFNQSVWEKVFKPYFDQIELVSLMSEFDEQL